MTLILFPFSKIDSEPTYINTHFWLKIKVSNEHAHPERFGLCLYRVFLPKNAFLGRVKILIPKTTNREAELLAVAAPVDF